MRSIRFSVAASMGTIVVIAAFLATLRNPSPLLANALFSLVILVLSLALIGVIFARRLDRARWAGALIAGGIAFALHFVPWFEQRFASLLVTAAVADILFERFAAPLPEEDDDGDGVSSLDPRPSHIVLVRNFGGFGGGKGGFGGPATPLPSASETWSSIERNLATPGFQGSPRTVGSVTIFYRAPAAMQRIVDCFAVLLSAIIGAVFARRCAVRAAMPSTDPPRT